MIHEAPDKIKLPHSAPPSLRAHSRAYTSLFRAQRACKRCARAGVLLMAVHPHPAGLL